MSTQSKPHSFFVFAKNTILRRMQHKTSSAHESISESESVRHGSPGLHTLPIVDTQVLSQDHITSESNLPVKSEERTSYPKNLTEGLVSATSFCPDLGSHLQLDTVKQMSSRRTRCIELLGCCLQQENSPIYSTAYERASVAPVRGKSAGLTAGPPRSKQRYYGD